MLIKEGLLPAIVDVPQKSMLSPIQEAAASSTSDKPIRVKGSKKKEKRRKEHAKEDQNAEFLEMFDNLEVSRQK